MPQNKFLYSTFIFTFVFFQSIGLYAQEGVPMEDPVVTDQESEAINQAVEDYRKPEAVQYSPEPPCIESNCKTFKFIGMGGEEKDGLYLEAGVGDPLAIGNEGFSGNASTKLSSEGVGLTAAGRWLTPLEEHLGAPLIGAELRGFHTLYADNGKTAGVLSLVLKTGLFPGADAAVKAGTVVHSDGEAALALESITVLKKKLKTGQMGGEFKLDGPKGEARVSVFFEKDVASYTPRMNFSLTSGCDKETEKCHKTVGAGVLVKF